MAINYTTLLGLAQPVTGTEANTWGDAVNTQLTALLDSAIAGAATISVTAGNVTLTDLDGAADQARMAILILTGTPGTTRNVVAPSRSKTYIVINQSDASAVIKGSATAGVTVRAGQAATCVWNGADFEIVASGDVDGPASATNNAIPTFDGTTGKLIKDNSGATISAGVITATGFSGPLNGAVGATTPSTVVATQVDITAQGDLRLQDTTGGQYVALQAPGTVATSYTLTLPVDDGTAGQALITDGSGVLSWSSAASGDVYGPASATDNAVARYDGTTGKIIQNSAVTIADDGATVIAANSTSDGLRITQTGTGNALLVEDAANPDATPVVIDAEGRLVVGNTSFISTTGYVNDWGIQNQATGAKSNVGLFRWAADAFSSTLHFLKSRNGTVGTQAVVLSGDSLGGINFRGSDGTGFVAAASMEASVDGTPGTNDMPGRLVFSTTADGASSPTERMRIDSAGVSTFTGTAIVNANSTTDALRITQTGTGNALLVEDSANPDSTPTIIDQTGRLIVGAASSFTPIVGIIPPIQVLGVSATTSTALNARFSNDTGGTASYLYKSRGADPSTRGIVSSGDTIGSLSFVADDGTTGIPAATINGQVDGTPGTNDMPGRLVFSTTADGASSPTERMRISSTGKITDQYGNIRAVTKSGAAKTTSYTLLATDVGQFIEIGSGGSVTIPDATMSAGDAVSLFNNTSGNITVTCSITTAYIAGTDSDKATVTLATRGVATILFVSGTVCVINGNVT